MDNISYITNSLGFGSPFSAEASSEADNKWGALTIMDIPTLEYAGHVEEEYVTAQCRHQDIEDNANNLITGPRCQCGSDEAILSGEKDALAYRCSDCMVMKYHGSYSHYSPTTVDSQAYAASVGITCYLHPITPAGHTQGWDGMMASQRLKPTHPTYNPMKDESYLRLLAEHLYAADHQTDNGFWEWAGCPSPTETEMQAWTDRIANQPTKQPIKWLKG